MMLLKCCTQYVSKFGKFSSGHRTGKGQVSFQSQRQCQRMFKHHTIVLISHASKVMLRIIQARLQEYVNHELPSIQPGFRKGRGTRDQIANIRGYLKKQESSRKTSTFALLTTSKPLTVWITQTGKFLKRWECQTI